MALNNIYEEVERSIYEAIRLVSVAEGYTPDITPLNNTPLDYEQYQAELTAIDSSKGFAIEIFNNTQPEDKGMIETSRISILHGGASPGGIGLPVEREYQEEGGGFYQAQGTTNTSEYSYDIYITSRSLVESRICMAIINQALPNRSWVMFYNTQEPDRFLNILKSGWSSPSELRGVKEYIYSYMIPDLITTLDTRMGDLIPPIVEIDLKLILHIGIQL